MIYDILEILKKISEDPAEIQKYLIEIEIKSRSWDLLKEWAQTQEYESRGKNYGATSFEYLKMIRKMNELEQEGVLNEKSKV